MPRRRLNPGFTRRLNNCNSRHRSYPEFSRRGAQTKPLRREQTRIHSSPGTIHASATIKSGIYSSPGTIHTWAHLKFLIYSVPGTTHASATIPSGIYSSTGPIQASATMTFGIYSSPGQMQPRTTIKSRIYSSLAQTKNLRKEKLGFTRRLVQYIPPRRLNPVLAHPMAHLMLR